MKSVSKEELQEQDEGTEKEVLGGHGLAFGTQQFQV